MLGHLIAFGLGVVASSIIWFFVWRNNKKLFAAKLLEIDNIVNKAEETKIGAAIKDKINNIS
jgi:hypothetical protein